MIFVKRDDETAEEFISRQIIEVQETLEKIADRLGWILWALIMIWISVL